MRRRLLAVLFFGASAVALLFLVLPVVAIFARVPPSRLLHQLSTPVVTDALVVSFKTTAIAQALILFFGTPLAYLVASRRFRGRALVVTLVELPLAIYAEFSVNFDVALALGALLVAISAALLLTLRLILSWRPSPRTSPSLFAPST